MNIATTGQAYSTPTLFADDTNITISGTNAADVENKANLEMARIYDWLLANKLHLNVAKTEFMLVGTIIMLKLQM